MGAGKYRDPITIKKRNTSGTDPDGHPIETAATEVQDWAHVLHGAGRQFLEGRAQLGLGVVEMDIRFREDVTIKDTIVLESKEYEIVEPPVNPDRKRKELRIVARLIEANK